MGTYLFVSPRPSELRPPVCLYGGTGRLVRVVGRIDFPAGTIGNGTSEKHDEDAVVDGARCRR